jgi:hypothetical protein
MAMFMTKRLCLGTNYPLVQDAFVKKVVDVTALFFFDWKVFPRLVLGLVGMDRVEV